MSKNQERAVREIVRQTVGHMKETERREVLEWAERSLNVVRDSNLSRREKLVQLRKVKSTKAVLRLLLAVARLVKAKTWDGQSWARRLTVGGLGIGFATFGTKAAGVAAMGTAVGVPLALITATGALVLGVVIDELKKP